MTGRKGGDVGAGSGSEGEMSDGTRRKKKKKFQAGSRSTSPNGSRASSPANIPPASRSNAEEPPRKFSAEEVALRVPPEGMALSGPGGMLELFGEETFRDKEFVARIKAITYWDKAAKKFFPAQPGQNNGKAKA